jgi:hypothetical protein
MKENKTYLVSEELLRQVLDDLEVVDGFSKSRAEIRTLLAKEPNEPVLWVHLNGEMFYPRQPNCHPLYRKDTP